MAFKELKRIRMLKVTWVSGVTWVTSVPRVTTVTRVTWVTRETWMTCITRMTWVTWVTRVTGVTCVTCITRVTKVTRVTLVTRVKEGSVSFLSGFLLLILRKMRVRLCQGLVRCYFIQLNCDFNVLWRSFIWMVTPEDFFQRLKTGRYSIINSVISP